MRERERASQNGCSLRGRVAPEERDRPPLLLLFLLVHQYVPAQDPIEQTLTPRDDFGTKKREGESEKDGEREKKYEEERSRGARENEIEVEREREETINNAAGKTKKRREQESTYAESSLSSQHFPPSNTRGF